MGTSANPSPLICSTTATDPGCPSKSGKRTLTEARREQNRVNQRTYRQKQRAQRLLGLPHRYIRSSVPKQELRPRPESRTLEPATITNDQAGSPTNRSPIPLIEPALIQEPDSILPSQEHVATAQTELRPPPLDSSCLIQDSFGSTNHLENFTETLFHSPSTIGIPYLAVEPSSTCIPPDFETAYPSLGEDLVSTPFPINEVTDIPDGEIISLSPLAFLSLELHTATSEWPLIQDESLPSSTSLSNTSIASQPHLHYIQDIPIQETSKQSLDVARVNTPRHEMLLRGRQSTPASPNIISSSCLPNPWMNNFQLSQPNFVLACIHNARSMGFLIEDTDSMMVQGIKPSPFYRSVTPADDPTTLLAMATKPSTPIHLRPTLPQILYLHPTFMDLIPIPSFRARAITLAATRPHLLDLWDLKSDIVQMNGLGLWSCVSYTTGSRRAGAGLGQPWDIRSWEAAPWFRNKWRMLLDVDERVWN
ncbi:hypothetical protein BP6252_07558 [Coleophoma cylindrospora]|uniref:BZIP domain-containing protein n=1 Tax=Coleophoma cylindrospora TaxID=1849047 RepID=A0A3D8RAE9_9HELO|nr:hypothetical protein BP6252_07558 [Coleophoma cylindrospora]